MRRCGQTVFACFRDADVPRRGRPGGITSQALVRHLTTGTGLATLRKSDELGLTAVLPYECRAPECGTGLGKVWDKRHAAAVRQIATGRDTTQEHLTSPARGDPAPTNMAAKKKSATKVKKPAKKAAKRKSGAASVPGVSRIDQDSTRTHGYFVRVGYHRNKEGAWRPKHRAFFGDASHGGKEKAFKAAVKWLKSKSK